MYADVTLVCDDNIQIPAHKIILSSFSQTFRSIIESNNESSNNVFIYLRGIKFSIMESIMEYIYKGETALAMEEMNEFLAVAKEFQIKEVGEYVNIKNSDVEEVIPPSDQSSFQAHTLLDEVEVVIETDDQEAESNCVNEDDCDVDETQNLDLQPSKIKGKEIINSYNDFISIDTLQDVSSTGFGKSEVVSVNGRKEMLHHEMDKVKKETKYSCKYCHKKYGQKTGLDYHINSQHENIKKHQCHKCDYKSASKANVNQHVRMMHENIRYKCDQCEISLISNNALTRHVNNIHLGIKWMCVKCDYKANRKCDLKLHYSTIHNELMD